MAQSVNSLPIGATVKFGTRYGKPIQWLVAEHGHSGYPANSTTLVSKYAVDVFAYDAMEPANLFTARVLFGNSRYRVSNIRQWLNSSAGAYDWYSPQHSADEPPSSSYVFNNAYYNRAGFLNEWSTGEAGYLLNTTHISALNSYDGTSDSVTDKVFLLSLAETGITSSNVNTVGSRLALFTNSAYRVATLTESGAARCDNSCAAKAGQAIDWWTCSASKNSTTSTVELVYKDGSGLVEFDAAYAYDNGLGRYGGVRPACNISGQTLVTDSTDTDGCYSVIVNSAPSAVSSLDVPQDLFIVSDTTITWGKATDVDGNLAGYVLECQMDDAAWTQIYKGSARSFTHNIPAGTQKIAYRVKAYDSYAAESTYITSETKPVSNNHAPTITGSYGDLGTFSAAAPAMQYQVDDFDKDVCTLTISLDGETFKTLTPVLGESATFTFTDDEWIKILNGDHALKLSVADPSGASASLDATFKKKVTGIAFVKKLSVASTDQPKRAVFDIQGAFPTGSTLKVEACNNGDDASPTWEDVSEAVSSGNIYEFTNAAKTAGTWGVKVKVTITRGTATDPVYITSIGGNFE